MSNSVWPVQVQAQDDTRAGLLVFAGESFRATMTGIEPDLTPEARARLSPILVRALENSARLLEKWVAVEMALDAAKGLIYVADPLYYAVEVADRLNTVTIAAWPEQPKRLEGVTY